MNESLLSYMDAIYIVTDEDQASLSPVEGVTDLDVSNYKYSLLNEYS
jgi:hypothetical protein